jgi:cell wall-associated NlpC family hydrolase|tara:strand:- start:12008 stop:12763 length:756 start_codon:yes stop_codon:yes gene_type:complete
MSSEYAFCSVSISPLRESPADSSEMVSQFIFGEIMEILETKNQWRKVKSLSDSYLGWLDEKCITKLNDEEVRDWKSSQILLFNATMVLESDEGPIHLTKGAFVSKSDDEFRIGEKEFKIAQEKSSIPLEIAEIAKSYLNAPYLWGGKTLFGIDCSGFSQMVYRFKGISIPRDADLQAKVGEEISFSLKQEGDLAFFINSKGKIHHVGIVLSDNKIIHAHGWLRIDELDEKGILGRSNEKYSHNLALIKRHV